MATVQEPRTHAKFDTYLESRLSRAKDRVRSNDIAIGLLSVLSLTIGFALVMLLVDRWLILPTWIRQLSFVGYLLSAAALAVKTVVRPWIAPVNPYFAARQVEYTLPECKNSIVSWLDLRERPLAAPIREALSRKAATDLGRTDVEEAVRDRRLAFFGWLTGGLILMAVVLCCLLRPTQFFSLISRTFNPFGSAAIAAQTRLQVVAPQGGNATIPIHRAIDFRVEVGGRIPNVEQPDGLRIRFRYNADDPAWEERRLEQSDRPAEWTVRIPASEVRNGFDYHVVGGDAQTPTYRINVRAKALITDFEVRYHYRPYLRYSDDRRADPNLQAVRGTQVTLVAKTNRVVKNGEMRVSPAKNGEADLIIPSSAVADRPDSLQFKLVLEQDGRYRLRFTAADGEESEETLPFDIHVLPDQPPQVEIAKPASDKIAANGIIKAVGKASDDFGITRGRLLMKMKTNADTPAEPLPNVEYRGGKLLKAADGSFPRQVSLIEVIPLEELKDVAGKPVALQPGMQLVYCFEAEDNCDFLKPQMGRSNEITVTIADPQRMDQRDQVRNEADQEKKDNDEKQDQAGADPNQPAEQPQAANEDKRPNPDDQQSATPQDKQEAIDQAKKIEQALKDQQNSESGDKSDSQQQNTEKKDGDKTQSDANSNDGGKEQKSGEEGSKGNEQSKGDPKPDGDQRDPNSTSKDNAANSKSDDKSANAKSQSMTKSGDKHGEQNSKQQNKQTDGEGSKQDQSAKPQPNNGQPKSQDGQPNSNDQKPKADAPPQPGRQDNKDGKNGKQGEQKSEAPKPGNQNTETPQSKSGDQSDKKGEKPGDGIKEKPNDQAPKTSPDKGEAEGGEPGSQRATDGKNGEEKSQKPSDSAKSGKSSQDAEKPQGDKPRGANSDAPKPENAGENTKPDQNSKGKTGESKDAGQPDEVKDASKPHDKAGDKPSTPPKTDGKSAAGKAADKKNDGQQKPADQPQSGTPKPEDIQKLVDAFNKADAKTKEQILKELEKMAKSAESPEKRKAAEDAAKECNGQCDNPQGTGGKPKPTGNEGGQGPSSSKGEANEKSGQKPGKDRDGGADPGKDTNPDGSPKPGDGKNNRKDADGNTTNRPEGRDEKGQPQGDGKKEDKDSSKEKGPPTKEKGVASGKRTGDGEMESGSDKPLSPINDEFLRESGDLQLENFRKKVDRNVLDKLQMTEEEFQKFLKTYEAMIKQAKEQANPGADDRQRGAVRGGSSANAAARKTQAGPQSGAKADRGGRGQAPPEFREQYKEFSEEQSKQSKPGGK